MTQIASSLQELLDKCASLNIEVKENKDLPLLNLCYSQIYTPKFDEFAMKCRGLVVDKNTLEIVCHPFNRFFNYGEGKVASELQTSTTSKRMNSIYNSIEDSYKDGKNQELLQSLSYYEKVDGSLIKIYYYEPLKKWLVGTKGQAICESKVFNLNNSSDLSFYDLVLEALNVKNDKELQHVLNSTCDNTLTYLFELTSKYNAVVVPHKETKLWFLGAVNKLGDVIENPYDHDFEEVYKKFPKMNKIYLPKKYDFKNINEAEIFSQNLPFNDEGYVIYCHKQPVFKIKSPAYVQVHLMSDKNVLFNENPVIKLVYLGELTEYLTYFKEESKNMLPYQQAKEQMFIDIVKEFLSICYKTNNKKEFAFMIKDTEFKNIHFALNKALQEYLSTINVNYEEQFELLPHIIQTQYDKIHSFLLKAIEEYINSLVEKHKIEILVNYMDRHNINRPFN